MNGPPPRPLDCEGFYRRVLQQGLSRTEIIESADREAGQYERLSAKRSRELGAGAYVAALKNLIFFLRTGIRPASACERQLELLKGVAAMLIEQKDLPESALEVLS